MIRTRGTARWRRRTKRGVRSNVGVGRRDVVAERDDQPQPDAADMRRYSLARGDDCITRRNPVTLIVFASSRSEADAPDARYR